MVNNDVGIEFERAIQDGKISPEKLDWVQNTFRENYLLALNGAKNSYLVFLIVTLLWLSIFYSVVNKISFMEIEIINMTPVLLILPLIAAIYFYRFTTLLFNVAYLNEFLSRIYNITIPSLLKEGISCAFVPPESIVTELIHLCGYEKRNFNSIYTIWGLTFSFIIICVPILVLSWISYLLIFSPHLLFTASTNPQFTTPQLIFFITPKVNLTNAVALLMIIFIIMSIIEVISILKDS
jgi:hypothetical protein